jgi:RNA polymerase sigma factor (sigma-70 family)
VARRNVYQHVTLPPFQALLDAHGREVHRFLVASVGRHAAEDCYQETWLAALRAYPRLRDAGNLRSWLLTIAQRKAIDHVRRRARQPLASPALPEGLAGPDAGAALAGVTNALAGAGTALAAAGAAPEHGDLWAAVRALPPKQRTAVAMRYALDADYATISQAMGISVEAARRNVHEALKQLRREYER